MVFSVFQGMTILIPSFVLMAFASSAFLIYVALALFSFGKYHFI